MENTVGQSQSPNFLLPRVTPDSPLRHSVSDFISKTDINHRKKQFANENVGNYEALIFCFFFPV